MIVKWIHKILLHYIKIDDNFSEIDIDIEFGSYLTKEQNLSKNRNYKRYNNLHILQSRFSWLPKLAKNNIGTPLKPKE
jgi:hypothetical protein